MVLRLSVKAHQTTVIHCCKPICHWNLTSKYFSDQKPLSPKLRRRGFAIMGLKKYQRNTLSRHGAEIECQSTSNHSYTLLQANLPLKSDQQIFLRPKAAVPKTTPKGFCDYGAQKTHGRTYRCRSQQYIKTTMLLICLIRDVLNLLNKGWFPLQLFVKYITLKICRRILAGTAMNKWYSCCHNNHYVQWHMRYLQWHMNHSSIKELQWTIPLSKNCSRKC